MLLSILSRIVTVYLYKWASSTVMVVNFWTDRFVQKSADPDQTALSASDRVVTVLPSASFRHILNRKTKICTKLGMITIIFLVRPIFRVFRVYTIIKRIPNLN